VQKFRLLNANECEVRVTYRDWLPNPLKGWVKVHMELEYCRKGVPVPHNELESHCIGYDMSSSLMIE